MDLLRKYRIQLEHFPFVNDQSHGISIIDFVGTFIIGWLLDKYFNLSGRLNITPKIYYACLIPIGIISHVLFVKKTTFLNSKLLTKEVNIYKIILLTYLVWSILI